MRQNAEGYCAAAQHAKALVERVSCGKAAFQSFNASRLKQRSGETSSYDA
jgi:hypothetical protein